MLEGRTIVITGANSGIGKETALELARQKASTVLVCRNIEKGEAAKDEIANKTENKSVDLLVCDLSSLAEVRKLADDVRARYKRVDVLVNNAGLFSMMGRTEDGFERTFEVNYLAPFLLTNLLLDRLKSSAPSRIVNVSSVAHYGGHVDLAAFERRETGSGWGAYSNSKLALVMFTRELARRLQGSGVTVNCLHPGAVATNIWRIPPAIMRPFLRSAKEGAQTSVYLSSSPEVADITGEYFEDSRKKRSSDESYDAKEAGALWDMTCRFVGLAN